MKALITIKFKAAKQMFKLSFKPKCAIIHLSSLFKKLLIAQKSYKTIKQAWWEEHRNIHAKRIVIPNSVGPDVRKGKISMFYISFVLKI
jgi:hypothetical protein